VTGRVNGIEALAGDMTRSRSARRWVVTAVVAAAVLALLTRPGAAHGGTLRLSGSSPQVPFWLVSLTGGGVIGVSFLMATLLLTGWGRIDWAAPSLALANVMVAFVPMSIGAALGDLLPGS